MPTEPPTPRPRPCPRPPGVARLGCGRAGDADDAVDVPGRPAPDGRSRGHARADAPRRRGGRQGRPCAGAWWHRIPASAERRAASSVRSALLSGPQLEVLRHGRARRGGRRDGRQLRPRRGRAHLGDRHGLAPQQALLELGAVGRRLRAVRPRGGDALQRPLHSPGPEDAASADLQLVGVERAEPRLLAGPPGRSRQPEGAEQRAAVPRAPRRRVERAARHRPRPGHDPVRRSRAAREQLTSACSRR